MREAIIPEQTHPDYALQNAEREKDTCCACGSTGKRGLVVCWTCWKRGKNPLKYFEGTFSEWLKIKGVKV